MTRNSLLLMAICSAAVVGCGDDTGIPGAGHDMAVGSGDMSANADLSIPGDFGPPIDMNTGITWEKFSLDTAQALCQHYITCGRLDAAQLDICITQNRQLTGWDIDSEILKGRVRLDETQCLAAIAAERCDDSDVGIRIARCGGLVYTPMQANGSACLSGVECTSGYCMHGQNAAGTAPQVDGCPGTCAPILAAGAACQTDEQCGPNAFCDNDDTNGPATNTCVAYWAAGEDCSSTTVSVKQFCVQGTYCPTFGATVCTAPTTSATLGQPCDPGLQAFTTVPACAAGLYCQIALDGMSAQCAPKLHLGDACNGDQSGNSNTDNPCDDGLTCYSLDTDGDNVAGHCLPYGSATPVDGGVSTCKRQSAASGTCKIGFMCEGSGSAPGPGDCVAELADGTTCAATAQCASYNAVLSTVCIADNADAGSNTTCQKPKGFGDSCILGFEDSLCWPAADPTLAYPNSSHCTATTGGNAVCAPLCN